MRNSSNMKKIDRYYKHVIITVQIIYEINLIPSLYLVLEFGGRK